MLKWKLYINQLLAKKDAVLDKIPSLHHKKTPNGVWIFYGAIKVEVGQPLFFYIIGSNKLLTDISIPWKY